METFNYIDTLYLSKNVGDYSDYLNTVSYLIDLVDESNATFLATAGGRTWYQFRDFKVGIMDYEQSKKSNNFQFMVQYKSIYLMNLGYYDSTYSSIVVPFGQPNEWDINRIDLTEINNLNLLDRIPLSSYRKKTYFKNGMEVETLYLGNRKNGNVFRGYNKSLEMKKKQSFDKMEFLSQIFDKEDILYTYELELHRSWLREKAQITSFKDLSKIFTIWNKIVGSIKWVEDTELNHRLISTRKRERINDDEIIVLADYQEFDYKEIKRNSTPSKYFLFDAMDRMLKGYNSNLEKSGHNTVSIIELLEGYIEYKHGKIIEYTVEDFENHREFIEELKARGDWSNHDVIVTQAIEAFAKKSLQGFRDLF